MRRKVFQSQRDEAIEYLRRAPAIHLATTRPDGTPILRVVHGVIVGDVLAFHGAPAGEKLDAIGREAVISASDIVAEIPSYFSDPERACPATTFYRSVQVHGILEEVTDLNAKAMLLQALMERYQPEGGHIPITAEDPHYRNAVKGLLVVQISLERIVGKFKLGQNKKPKEISELIARLWQRGRKEDVQAIELIREANPEAEMPAFLDSPEGTKLVCSITSEEDIATATSLLMGEDAYWNQGLSADCIREGLRHSGACVGVKDLQTGELIAVTRAISDYRKHAWIYDVMVAPAWRQKGVGKAILRLILEHPEVRHAWKIHLGTKDAQRFYESFGFLPAQEAESARTWTSTHMIRTNETQK